MSAPRLVRIALTGDAALTAELEPRLDVAINRTAAALGAIVRKASLAGVRDVVVTAHTVTAYVEPLRVDWAALEALLRSPVTLATEAGERKPPRRVTTIYGGDRGPDLEEVARSCGCTPADVIAWHTARPYRVFMVGFMPGFAYLGTLDERLHLPRRSTPRLRVSAGAVAIAGAQTAVYPFDTPGGWWIIGHTEWRPFDAHREPACLVEVGDSVRFEAR